MGFGAPHRQGRSATHGSPLGADEVAAARAGLGWTAEPFIIPADIAAAWAAFGDKGKALHAEWDDRLASSEKKRDFEARIGGKVTPGDAFNAYLDGLVAAPPKVATRDRKSTRLKSSHSCASRQPSPA